MTIKEIEVELARACREVADEKDPSGVDQTRTAPKKIGDTLTQEQYEQALASFNTVVKDGIRQSLNSAMKGKEAHRLLEALEKDKPKDSE